MKSRSIDCEWVGPYPRRPPIGVLIINGSATSVPYIVGNLSGVLQQLVDDQRAEIAEHDFDYGLLAGKRPTDGETGETGFTDRRVAHAPRILVRQPARYLEGAAVGAWREFVAVFDVFAEKEEIAVLSEQAA